MYFTKKLVIACCSIILIFSACEKEDKTSPSSNQSTTPIVSSSTLVGDWEMTSLDYAGASSVSAGGSTITTQFTGVGKNFTYTIEFTDNPKRYSATGGYTVTLTSLFNGSSNVQDVPIPDASSSGTWSLNGNTLTITDDVSGDPTTTEILSSSNNNTFSMDFAGFFGQSVQGADVTFTSGQISFNRK
tara:strand:+ start:665 stop:1225 length:561 start_codon:yes stop_codon:yes gene_type:complete